MRSSFSDFDRFRFHRRGLGVFSRVSLSDHSSLRCWPANIPHEPMLNFLENLNQKEDEFQKNSTCVPAVECWQTTISRTSHPKYRTYKPTFRQRSGLSLERMFRDGTPLRKNYIICCISKLEVSGERAATSSFDVKLKAGTATWDRKKINRGSTGGHCRWIACKRFQNLQSWSCKGEFV